MDFQLHSTRSSNMDTKQMLELKNIDLAPYMQIATELIKKARHAGGNMFRHQIDTMGILMDYGYIDSILLKASVVHDCIEDIKGFDINRIIKADSEGYSVYRLVMEVSRRVNETKPEFLERIIRKGSLRAKVLKCADRISNMISLGFVTECEFIERYCDETETYIFPTAIDVDFNMYQELIGLVMTRRKFLEDSGYINRKLQKLHKEPVSL